MLDWGDWLNAMGYVRLNDRDGYYGVAIEFEESKSVVKKYKNYRIEYPKATRKLNKIMKNSQQRKGGMKMEWQPIETAPRDGSWIIFTSTWNEYARACGQYKYEGFYTDLEQRIDLEMYSHWMPLPEPPNKPLANSGSQEKEDEDAGTQ